jgi:UDP:flavonoid glycosyltransferase YjiC (YdhE family)
MDARREIMRILVATLGSYGDVYPFIALATVLKKREHDIVLLTNDFFRPLADRHGLTLAPIGSDAEYRQFADHPDLFHPTKGASVYFDTLILPSLRTAYDRLREWIRQDETVIVASTAFFSARLIQEALHIPTVTVHLAPAAFKSAHESPQFGRLPLPAWIPPFVKRSAWWIADRAVLDPMLCPALNSLRREVGLPPTRRVMTKWLHSPECVIGLFPDWYAAPQPDWPPQTRLTGFPLFDDEGDQASPDEVEEFLQAGDSPIVFMPGSLMQRAESFFTASVGACERLRRRGILLTRYSHHLPGNLPDGIRHFDYVPFSRLLPRAAAVVHHGGIGCVSQALCAGVPQLIYPMAFDQHDNATRLRGLGVGDSLAPHRYRADAVADRLGRLLDSSGVTERCGRIASRLEQAQPLVEASELIEAMLER